MGGKNLGFRVVVGARTALGAAAAGARWLLRTISNTDDNGARWHSSGCTGVVKESGADAERAVGSADRPEVAASVVLLVVDAGYGWGDKAVRAEVARRLEVDHGRLDSHTGLGWRHNYGVLSVDGRGNTGPRGVRRPCVRCPVGEARVARVGRVAEVTRNEEVLLFGARGRAGLGGVRDGNWDGRDWRDEDGRRGRRGTVHDTRDIRDLDDV